VVVVHKLAPWGEVCPNHLDAHSQRGGGTAPFPGWLTHSVWPSICRWHAVDIVSLIPKSMYGSCMKSVMNCGPQSLLTVELPDFLQVESHGALIDCGVHWHEMCMLSDAVDYIYDCIVAVCSRKFNHKVNSDCVPLLLWSLHWVQLHAEVAGLDVETNVTRHLLPPVVLHD